MVLNGREQCFLIWHPAIRLCYLTNAFKDYILVMR
jgi:hypothetical protein